MTNGRKLALVALLAFQPGGISAEQTSQPAGCSEAEVVRRLRTRDGSSALVCARELAAEDPGSTARQLLLAHAYLETGNLFWAERTLRRALDGHEDLVEARSLLAWVHVRQADLALAREVLATGAWPDDGPQAARRALLQAFVEELSGDAGSARERLRRLGTDISLTPEDWELRGALERRLRPGWRSPFELDGEINLGGTTNAVAGVPTDPGTPGTGSGFTRGGLRARLAWPGTAEPRPVAELAAAGPSLFASEARDLGYLEVTGRAGLEGWRSGYRLFAGARFEQLFVNQEEPAFSRAWRGELEIESRRLAVIAGGGKRTFRDEARSGWEWDALTAFPVARLGRQHVVLGAAIRSHQASTPAWDLRGAALSTATSFSLPRRLTLRVALRGAYDLYPHSGGIESLPVFGTERKRRDVLGTMSVGIWAPLGRTLEAGLFWQAARRDSTADQGPFRYSYTEHRVAVGLRLQLAAGRRHPRVTNSGDRVPIHYDLEEGGLQDRVIEMLRRDEELQRECGCTVP